MSSQPIILVVNMKAKDGQEETLRDLLGSTARLSRAEDGCLLYELLEAKKEPGSFIVFEKWRDPVSFKAHQDSPHLKEAFSSFERLLASPPSFEPWREVA